MTPSSIQAFLVVDFGLLGLKDSRAEALQIFSWNMESGQLSTCVPVGPTNFMLTVMMTLTHRN
tara:strand:- start:4442 stop:4630 length:189 start_codon:yes stop_codon:yes gene_type:complete